MQFGRRGDLDSGAGGFPFRPRGQQQEIPDDDPVRRGFRDGDQGQRIGCWLRPKPRCWRRAYSVRGVPGRHPRVGLANHA